MSQPVAYTPGYNCTAFQVSHPSQPLPGASVDTELSNVSSSIAQICTNLKIIQRDDGAIANQSVGIDQLKTEVSFGFNSPTVWITAHAYVLRDSVQNGNGFYRCIVAHTSTVFATDLAAGYWQVLADFTTSVNAAAASATAAASSATAAASSASGAGTSATAAASSATAGAASQTAAAASATAAASSASAAAASAALAATANPFSDATAIVKNGADATKKIKLSAASVTAGATRTLTAQDKDYVVADNADVALKAPLNSPALTGTPTAPQAAQNTSTNQVATCSFANPAASLAASGYVKLPSSIIIQWGSVSAATNAGANQSISFPLTFPTALYAVTLGNSAATLATGDAGYTDIVSSSASGFVLQYTCNRFWIAIGS